MLYILCVGGIAYRNSTFGKPKRNILYSGVHCRGSETEVRDCTHHRLATGTVTGNVAGVQCGSTGILHNNMIDND